MAVPEFFNTLEQSGLSTWLRESDSVFSFYFILLCHTIGLALLVGTNAVLDLRLLGVASDLPLKSFKPFFSVMWLGFGINAISGVFLLIAYPTKAFTNPVFYLKLLLIASAVVIMQRMKNRLFGDVDSHRIRHDGSRPVPGHVVAGVVDWRDNLGPLARLHIHLSNVRRAISAQCHGRFIGALRLWP